MPREDWERLGKSIRTARKAKGLTLQEAADRYGASLRWWQRLERGRNVSLDGLLRIAKALGVSASKLLQPF